jgi:hypothetical protein
MPNRRRNVKDEFWVVVLVAVIIVAALIIMWWKWIILGVLLVALVFALVFILKAVSKNVASEREPHTMQKTVFKNVASEREPHTMQKTVFENVASEREPLSPYEKDEETPETFIKGEKFQDYIRDHLFTKDKFDMLHKTHAYAINKKDFAIEDNIKPDFKFRVRETREEFWVEAKYRTKYDEDKVECYRPDQLERYKEEELPVYIALGLGGDPDLPDQVFLIPVKYIQSSYPKLFLSFLKKYAVPKDKPIDYKRLQ